MLRKITAIALMSMTTYSYGAQSIEGSDTLAGVMTDAIIASGLDQELVYTGGGSGKGEKAVLDATQGLAPMSRAFKDANRQLAASKGIELEEAVIGLDGVGVFANKESVLASLNLDEVRRIFTCEITNWSQVGGPSLEIAAYRRDDFSGTTDTFKKLVGIEEFGACVTAMDETSDIAAATSQDLNAVGYSGMSAKRANNKALALAKDASSPSYLPTVANVRSFDYPLARNLYVYKASGSVSASDAEVELFENLLDPSFINPILQDNDFFTLED